MQTEHFLEITTKKGLVTISKSSIASMEQGINDLVTTITLKERDPNMGLESLKTFDGYIYEKL